MKTLLITLFVFCSMALTFGQSDLCAGAPLLTVSATCQPVAYNVSTAFGAEAPVPSCGAEFRDGFFRFVANSTSTTITVTDGVAGPDPILAIYSGPCGSLVQIGCSNNGNNNTEQVTVATTIGSTYYIAISRNNNLGSNDMSGTVCVSQVAPPLTNTDCVNATQVCNSSAFIGNSNGAGANDLPSANDGCLSGEHQSSWYYFQAQTSGTVAFTIATTTDYDFALWTGGCGSLGAPVRCSFAGTSGNTGLSSAASPQVSEGAGGDGFVDALPVTAGQTYILLIDNYLGNGTNFNLNWTFTGGATLNCAAVPLPVEMKAFNGSFNGTSNELKWITESESNSDHFVLERSTDGKEWTKVAEKTAQGFSLLNTDYIATDNTFEPVINYYRLREYDTDGRVQEFYKLVSIDNRLDERPLTARYSLLGQEVDENYKGIVILHFSDGTTMKVVQ